MREGLFIGITTLDILYPVDSYPNENEKVNALKICHFVGGPATNAAITFAALGGVATLVSAVGDHHWGTFIKNRLKKYNVKHMDLAKGSSPVPTTSSIAINVKNGNRTVFTASSSPYTPDSTIPEDVLSGRYDVLCTDGFLAPLVIDICDRQVEKISPKVVFDGGSYKPETDHLLQHVSHPIFSERFTWPHADPLESFLHDQKIDQYAITRGERPILYFHKDTKVKVEVPEVRAVDTLAAGDIFHGAFSYYICDHDFINSLSLSANIASLSCQFLGPRKWIEHIK